MPILARSDMDKEAFPFHILHTYNIDYFFGKRKEK